MLNVSTTDCDAPMRLSPVTVRVVLVLMSRLPRTVVVEDVENPVSVCVPPSRTVVTPFWFHVMVVVPVRFPDTVMVPAPVGELNVAVVTMVNVLQSRFHALFEPNDLPASFVNPLFTVRVPVVNVQEFVPAHPDVPLYVAAEVIFSAREFCENTAPVTAGCEYALNSLEAVTVTSPVAVTVLLLAEMFI